MHRGLVLVVSVENPQPLRRYRHRHYLIAEVHPHVRPLSEDRSVVSGRQRRKLVVFTHLTVASISDRQKLV